jgi:hypothetical protein
MVMIRPRVYSRRDAATDPSKPEDTYLAKVVKYIPAEIVAAYVAASGAIESARATIPFRTIQWITAVVLFLLTPAYILVFAKDPKLPPPVYQAVAGAIAFACWVFALSNGPFSTFGWYVPLYGTLILILFTLLVPLGEALFP